MYNIRVGNVFDFAPLLPGIAEQFIDVPDFSAAIQSVLQALQAATLDPHFLRMGQGGVAP